MTNFDKWKLITKDLPSPENYVNWGFLYLIAASLQRRVWCPPDWRRCYPNIYVSLVGAPGIGKGQIIKTVYELLSYHKLAEVNPHQMPRDAKDKQVVDAMLELNIKDDDNKLKDELLFPIAADCVTYEKLVQTMAGSVRRINYYAYNKELQKNEMKIETYTSLCFCLEEIASLFRKNTESLVNFLIQAYDCGDKYEYDTKHSGKDRILRLCLNFFGGTNPDFMQDTFDDKLLSQGYSSRTFYIYAARNRKPTFFLPEQTAEQKQAKSDLLDHLKKLSSIFGQVEIDKEIEEFLQNWIVDFEENPQTRASKSPKLIAYYARKNIHIMKIAMAMHFGESTDLKIPLDTFKRAIAFLHEEEKTMHYALVLEGNNAFAALANKLKAFLNIAGKQTYTDLWMEFQVKKEELEEALEMLQSTNQIDTEQGKNELGEPVLLYKIKRIAS